MLWMKTLCFQAKGGDGCVAAAPSLLTQVFNMMCGWLYDLASLDLFLLQHKDENIPFASLIQDN